MVDAVWHCTIYEGGSVLKPHGQRDLIGRHAWAACAISVVLFPRFKLDPTTEGICE